jgi:cyclopropane-fatty-acyl-phospholipid synthase
VRGPFDRIVSVGMFEHVGSADYDTFFARVAALLREDGVALIHAIGRLDGPCATNPFVAKWIFPGGALPALSEVTAAVEKSGLLMTDIEILRLHYAETLRQWRRRFLQHAAEAERIAGPAFVRMWEFYLAGCEAAFRHQYLMVFQLQLAKRIDTVPLTRDYMVETERRLAQGAPALRPLGVVPFKREHKG